MSYPEDYYNVVPVVLPQRPHKNRPRLASAHHARPQAFYPDINGLLVPENNSGAGVRRSHSQAGPKTAPIIIYNTHVDDHSPDRLRRRSHQDYDYTSDETDDRADSHERHRRSRSRGRHATRHRHQPRTPSPAPNPEIERQLQRLHELEHKEQEEAARQKFEEQKIIDEARKAKEAKEREAMKQLAIEEHNAKVLEEKMKKKQKEEDEEKAFHERMRSTMIKAGYSEDSIEKTLKGKREKEDNGKKIMDLTRPTYIKVHRKHLSPDTLDLYDLPWEWDDVSNVRAQSEA